MSPARFVGRIGGLAAALGVGAAIFSVPGVALADPDGGDGSPSGAGSGAAAASTEDRATTAASPRTRVRRGQVAATPSAPSAPPLASRNVDTAATAVTDVVEQTTGNRSSGRSASADTRASLPSTVFVPSVDPAASAIPRLALVPTAEIGPAAGTPVALPAGTLSPLSAASLTTAQATTASITTTQAPRLATTISTVLNRISNTFSTVVGQLLLQFSGPLSPGADHPIAWAFLAAVRKQFPDAASVNLESASLTSSQTAPEFVLNGYNIVPSSTVNVVSFYGLYTAWPSGPGTVQGNQTFDVVDPKTGETVGSFKAMIATKNSNSIGFANIYKELVVTEVLSGTPGAEAGQTPPVGSVISAAVRKGGIGSVYSAMPTADGNVIKYERVTPFGTFRLPTQYDAASKLTDQALVNQPMQVGKGFYIAPKTPSTETFITASGLPPFFTCIQGSQTFSVYDSSNKTVGNFEGLVTTTSDLAGIYTKAILVTANSGGPEVGTGVGQVPPVGTVYNVIYFWNNQTYILYSSKPSTPRDVLSTKFVGPLGSTPYFTFPMLNASKAPKVNYQIPGGYKFVPVSDMQPIGVNGLPPREVVQQGFQQFDVYNADGVKIGSVDADVSRQWDSAFGHSEAILVTNVRSGTAGVGMNEIPPVGSVFNWDSLFPGFATFDSAMPGPKGGDLTSHTLVTPIGFIPGWSPYDAAKGLSEYTFVNPFAP